MQFKLRSNIDALEKAINPRTNQRILGRQGIQAILSSLTSIGFDRCRFYEISYNWPVDDWILILAASFQVSSAEELIGFKIPYKDSSLGKSGKHYPIVDCGFEGKKTDEEMVWINKLSLHDKCWVDIPLRVGKDLLGLIACDWRGTKSDLPVEDLALLNIFGSQIASLLLPDSDKLLDQRKRLQSVIDKGDSSFDIVKMGSDAILRILGGSIGAIFEYDWISGQIVKTHEFCEPSLEKKRGNFQEKYLPGQYLTGTAWNDTEYCHIADFESLIQNHPNLIEPNSHDRHRSLLRNISSILYSRIGNSGCEYLLRIMNRAANHNLHLVDRHKKIFDALCSDLSVAVERATSNSRRKNIQAIARIAVEKVGLSNEVCTRITDILVDEKIHNYGVLAHARGAFYITERKFVGKVFDDYKPTPAQPWQDDQLYSKFISENEPHLLRTSSDLKDLADNNVFKYLAKKQIESILIFPLHLVNVDGLFFLPLPARQAPNPYVTLALMKKDYPYRMDQLSTLSDIVGSCIEANISHMNSEMAQHVIGHIGHEVSNPVAILQQSAIKALYTAKGIFRDKKNPDLYLPTFDDLEIRINKEMRHIKTSMDNAKVISEESRGRLQYNFRSSSIHQILTEAKAMLQNEMHSRDQRGIIREYIINLKQSCERLPSIVCDPDMLHHAFINLLRNGIKYSLPPGHGRPMEITVEGNPQSHWAIVRVSNWGIGIPQENYELIFRPFFRSDVTDRKKSLTGMGLGLFLCRQIISAHRGEVFCVESRCTFDDKKRKEENPYEGFQTIFEVRIPLNIPPGIRFVNSG